MDFNTLPTPINDPNKQKTSFFGHATFWQTQKLLLSSTGDFVPACADFKNDLTACLHAVEQSVQRPIISRRIQTPLKPDAFAFHLKDHPRAKLYAALLLVLRNGAELEYTGSFREQFTPNQFPCQVHCDILIKVKIKEVEVGDSIGPFHEPPIIDFVVNSLGVISKKSGGFGVIMDLNRPDGYSIIDYIDKSSDSLADCSVDDDVRLFSNATMAPY